MVEFLIIFFAEYLGSILVAAFLVFWWQNRKKQPRFLWQTIAAAVLSRGIVTEAIRFFWERPRPFVEQNLTPLIEHAASSSFPSGHAALFFAIAAVVYAYNKKAGLFFFAGAVLIGIGRVLAGLHLPSDIVGGAVVGVLSGILVVQLSKRIWKNK